MPPGPPMAVVSLVAPIDIVKFGEVPEMTSGAHENTSESTRFPERPLKPTMTWFAGHIAVCEMEPVVVPRVAKFSACVVFTVYVVVPVIESVPQTAVNERR